jgi:uncharacterized protein (UPF0548 family)
LIPSLLRPSRAAIDRFLQEAAPLVFDPDVARLARGEALPGYADDHYRRRLGAGPMAFDLARRAIREWKMFHLGWIEVAPPAAPIEEGTQVALLARSFGAWTLNPARIWKVYDESGPIDRFGFTYAALPGHAEAGIESFMVEWDHADDSVWYDLHGVSRPGRFFTRWLRPLTRRVQKRFAAESMDAMERFVASEGES